MKQSFLSLRAFLFTALLVVHAAAAPFPGAEWTIAARPEDAGFSGAKLAEARAYSKQIKSAAVMIVHDGVVVDQWGDVTRKLKSHSLRKSFMAFLYGKPVREGLINLDATMADLGIDDVLGLSDEEKKATVRDCLKARSGVYHPANYESKRMQGLKPARHSQKAGVHWYYNNWDFNVLGTIYENATRCGVYDAIENEIARPIGMQDFTAKDGDYVTGPHSMHRAYPFRISARDLARFGLLALHRGTWNGRQVIDPDWVDECVRYHSDAALYSTSGYGYLWWVARDFNKHPHLPHTRIPEGSFSARGAGGHHLLVIPAYNLIIVHRMNTNRSTNTGVGANEFGRLVELILAARLN